LYFNKKNQLWQGWLPAEFWKPALTLRNTGATYRVINALEILNSIHLLRSALQERG